MRVARAYNATILGDRVVDLSAYAGVTGFFELRVEAGGSALQDRAVWAVAQVERP